MPLVRISIRRGKDATYKTALVDGIYAAMREAFSVPEDDLFMTIDEHDADTFAYSPSYLGIARGDDLVIVQITANDTRDLPQKKAFYRGVADNLARSPGVRTEDVFINLVEVKKENWSFGNGIAQYA